MKLPIVQGPDNARSEEVRARIDQLTKPLGSLGKLEALAIRLAGIAPLPMHGYERRAVLIGAADHGITAEGVSAYPSDVTEQMVGAFLGDFAAINAFARSAQAKVFVADFGMRTPIGAAKNLFALSIAKGTGNFAQGPAMTIEQYTAAVEAGIQAVALLLEQEDVQMIALGEMGIGNTTSAAALIAALTNTDAARVVGRGTGIDDPTLARKTIVVADAVANLRRSSPHEICAAVGGFEIIGLAGAILACAQRRIPVLLDGFIVSAAALVAATLVPLSKTVMIAAHQSVEPGHAVALAALGLEPLLQLDLRLGEATGATLAFGLCDAAARMVTEMKTFAQAGVSEAHEASIV